MKFANIKFKYVGLTMAALLATAPITTTALTAIAGQNNRTVQAATTTSGVTGEFAFTPDKANGAHFNDGAKIFANSALNSDTGRTIQGPAVYTMVGVALDAGNITAYQVANPDGQVVGWVAAADFKAYLGPESTHTVDLSTPVIMYAQPDSTWRSVSDISIIIKADPGAALKVKSFVLNNRAQISGVIGTNNAGTRYAADVVKLTNNK
ncbi:hypothetical protein FC83_GL002982 [Agrilactobacillus composti DSM 18527 = JCM 14202]|uniref:Extracellular protein n=1 Tax=Agrilactobacillus composti DSM 18527 = JCM 14202 TaxID=1423734 RepID=X0PQH2_9LACO|nr:hypothetical protein [Agrilactobacillus composti]KRM36231.1 hypothetical protein FC83_GL002982 [Agrilactobacillus composti DSM 18527 = JCM 14202]GAF39967.1 hypothetical protein JCM14202_1850 [Agrilactobacillus composti DSM 18527 = JCM 14202]